MTEFNITVENVGGIGEASFTFEETVSIISGPNATNKTSLLQAIAFGLGRDNVSIRNDADEARVTLSIGGESFTRTARRSGRGITISGEGYLSDSEDKRLFDYFGCLLEFNPLRSAVRQDEEIEPVLKEPVDIDTLEQRRSTKMQEKRSLQQDVERLGDVESEIRDQEQTLERKREERSELEQRLDELQEKQTESTAPDDELDTLREERTDLVLKRDEYERQIADLEGAIERLEADREEIEAELEEQRELAEEYDLGDLKSERTSLQDEIDDIERRYDILQSVLTANREMLNSEHTGALGQETDLMSKQVDCWVCGRPTEVDAIEETIDELQALVKQDKQKKREVKPKVEELEEQISEGKRAQRRVRNLEGRIDDIEQKLQERRESLATKRDELEGVREEISELDEEIAALEAEQASEITDLTDEIEEVRVDLQTVEQTIESTQERIETLEEQKREREEKRDRIDELSDEITELTDRIENLETHLREEFNGAMDDLVSRLDFDRIERIWLDGNFELVIARDVDGSVREDTVETLAESEREIVGLVLALAGYTAFDLDEIVPVLLIDTLGALDTTRTDLFLEYFSDRPEFLIASVLPENAGTISHSVVNPAEHTRSGVHSD